MTTIRDMILRDLRAIGAAGVAFTWCGLSWPIESIDGIRSPEHRAADRSSMRQWYRDVALAVALMLFARPAFRDDDGRLVPLPDGWEVIDKGRLRMQGTGVVRIVCIRHRGVWWLPRCGFYPTAPAAWRAAEQWIKEQGR